MTSIERTAYPRFTGLVTARELVALSPTSSEVAWARERTRSDEYLLALLRGLKCFQRLGYFPKPDDVPVAVVDHLRHCLELPADTCATTESQRSGQRHRDFVRERLGGRHSVRSGGEEQPGRSDQRRVGAVGEGIVGVTRVLDVG